MYDREFTRVFAIQDEISRGIVNSLRLQLGRGRRRYETSAEAYDLYLRARALGGGGDFGYEGFRQSVPAFEQVIAKDPAFAPAYAGLAVAHLVLSGNAENDIDAEVAKLAIAARKAVFLDPLSEAHDALAVAYARQGEWQEAAKSYRRAIELQPGRAETHVHYAAYYLLPLGRFDDAIRELRFAQKGDPLSSYVSYWLGDALVDTGHYEEGARVCGKIRASNLNGRFCYDSARELQGKLDDVIRDRQTIPGRWQTRVALGCAYARSGRRAESERVAAALADASRAEVLACLGDKERVFQALLGNTAVGPIRMGWMLARVDREHRGLLGGDPRLTTVRRAVGLPE